MFQNALGVVAVLLLLLLLRETPKSFGAEEDIAADDAACVFEDNSTSGSEASFGEAFDAISRSFPSRKESVEALGVAESERRVSRLMHEADSTDGGRRRVVVVAAFEVSLVLANRSEFSSRSSERRAAASICSEIVELSLWSVRLCNLEHRHKFD